MKSIAINVPMNISILIGSTEIVSLEHLPVSFKLYKYLAELVPVS